MFSLGWQAVHRTTSVWGGSGEGVRGEGVRGPTSVSLQFLHYLFSLEVPNVHHIVLGTGHYPLQADTHCHTLTPSQRHTLTPSHTHTPCLP